jgi:hypothetical protein
MPVGPFPETITSARFLEKFRVARLFKQFSSEVGRLQGGMMEVVGLFARLLSGPNKKKA